MTDEQYRRADDGRVLNTAMAAVMLITAGLALMVWENYYDGRHDTVTVSTLQQQ